MLNPRMITIMPGREDTAGNKLYQISYHMRRRRGERIDPKHIAPEYIKLAEALVNALKENEDIGRVSCLELDLV
ncbi:hypothetical protein CMI37_17100 [Candidatus Pacearchaeota archaeon]|nr:hypothetical protein [Candidatus Pacearchaeota archaeon]|tara:strand:- start:1872 stop:2093 length:222 start_codon:yes stop_codon:yes gene_type:complete